MYTIGGSSSGSYVSPSQSEELMMSRHGNRREFLKRSALAGTGLWMAGACAMGQSRSPNEKLNIGIIGVHSRGAANMAAVATENIVALCDVDENYLAEAAAKFP